MDQIILDDVIKAPGLSRFKAGMIAESCLVTLHRKGHNSGICMKLTGDFDFSFMLTWTTYVTEQILRTYADQQEATEHAAEHIAILISSKIMGFSVIERSVKKTGIDYWLGNSDDILFQKKARLEISGIFEGNERKLERRFRQKIYQTNLSDHTGLPAIVSVTCFEQPLTKFATK